MKNISSNLVQIHIQQNWRIEGKKDQESAGNVRKIVHYIQPCVKFIEMSEFKILIHRKAKELKQIKDDKKRKKLMI